MGDCLRNFFGEERGGVQGPPGPLIRNLLRLEPRRMAEPAEDQKVDMVPALVPAC